MSIYHRRVFLKAKKPGFSKPQIERSTQASISSQSVPSILNFLPSPLPNQFKPSSFNCLIEKLHNLSNNQSYSIIMSVITIYTIFAIDIDKAFFNVQASTYFSSVHCMAVALFIMEILLLSITKEGYKFKFYFWIDCFSTLTMLLELIWIENLMSTSSDVTVALSFAKVTKASRLSKIGARSSKIMKLIRLVKLIKFFNRQEKQSKAEQMEMDENRKTILKEVKSQQNKDTNTKIEENTSKSMKNVMKCEIVEEESQLSSQDQRERHDGGKIQRPQEQREDQNNSEIEEDNQESEISQCQMIDRGQIENLQKQIDQKEHPPHQQPSFNQPHHQTTQSPQNQPFEYPSFHNITNEPKFMPPNNSNNDSHQMNLQEENFQAYSFYHDSNEMISEEDKSNIEDIMKLFFTQNMNRFVEEGKLISSKNCGTKKDCGIDAFSVNNHQEGSFRQSGKELKGPTSLHDGTDSDGSKRLKNSNRLSYMKRKDMNDVSRNRGDRQKASRFNKNYTAEAPFSNIVQRLQKSLYLPPITRPYVDKEKQEQMEKKYQELVEKMREQKEPKKVASQNLKVGEVLKQEIQKNIVIMVMGLIMVIPIITADTWFDSDVMLNTTANIFIEDIKQLPTDQARAQLMESFIKTGLQMTNPLEYFNVPINDTCCEFPRQFPAYAKSQSIKLTDLRLSEQNIVIDDKITIIFSKKSSSQFTAYLNLGRSLFITILLIFCSVLFMKDIQNYALNPLEKMSTLINKISNNPFEALKQINQEKQNRGLHSSVLQDEDQNKLLIHKVENKEDQKLQTNILSNAIIKITSLLTIGAGEIGSEIISKNIENLNEEKSRSSHDLSDTLNNSGNEFKSLGQAQVAIYVFIQLRHFERICDVFGDQIFKYINKVADIVHQDAIELGGIPIEYDGNGFLLLWKPTIEIANEDEMTRDQNQTLSKLAILAVHSVTKIFLDVNKLEESRKFYQYMSQRTSNESETGSKVMFVQNYEPHLLNASFHVGESFYGSMGSYFKLQCKCVGYDVAYTRFLSNMMDEEGYGAGVVLSQDFYSLLEEQENIVKRLKLRKIDQLKIKEIRFRDKYDNPNLTYMNERQLQNIKPYKMTKTSIYTFDFSGKLQAYNSNESQLINIESSNGGFLLNRTHQFSEYSHKMEKSANQEKGSKSSSVRNLSEFQELDVEKNKKILVAYKEREKWLQIIEQGTANELVSKLEAEYQEIKKARECFEQEFYQNWSDALQCYYAKEFTEATNELKFLHTFNQPYNDSPAKVFMRRLENLNLDEIELESLRTEDEESENSESSGGEDNKSRCKVKKKKWNGAHEVVWKL